MTINKKSNLTAEIYMAMFFRESTERTEWLPLLIQTYTARDVRKLATNHRIVAVTETYTTRYSRESAAKYRIGIITDTFTARYSRKPTTKHWILNIKKFYTLRFSRESAAKHWILILTIMETYSAGYPGDSATKHRTVIISSDLHRSTHVHNIWQKAKSNVQILGSWGRKLSGEKTMLGIQTSH